MREKIITLGMLWMALGGSIAMGQTVSRGFTWNAQQTPVQHFEGELSIGFTEPFGSFYGSKKTLGAALGLELRYNLDELPIDVGLLMGITTAVHTFDVNDSYVDATDGHEYHTSYQTDQSNRTFILAIMSDWNFRQGRRVNPFVGIGIGWGGHDIVNDWEVSSGEDSSSPIFIPRVGVELFRHLRFTLSSHVSRKGYNNAQLSIGMVIGGRPKK